jgi:CheY-like chemotaxis protein
VTGIEKLLRRSVREDIEMSVTLHDDVPQVVADAGQIEQVLLNLVVNARDAMPEGGKVSISIAPAMLEPGAKVSPPVPSGAYVAISVVDTGEGIRPADLPYIFEPFFTTKDESVGTGLGLSTVYGIVAQSGGGIEVAAPPNGGTRMTIYLPAAAAAVDEPDEESSVPRSQVGQETILLVEDEDPVRDIVRRVLEDAGYDVLAAARPSDAQRIVAETSIDLLVTDVVMPEMSGYDLALRVRLSQPESRTLFISGYAHNALAEAEKTPGGELLRKPFSPEDLKRAVRTVLDA